MDNFDVLGLAQPVLDAVKAQGYDTPTPIQSKAIPTLLDGRDIIGLAQTGTGKTAAFVLPLLSRLYEDKAQPPGKTCRALILSPTRELAAQIGDSVAAYSKGTGLKFGVICGGVKYGPQIKVLSRGLHVLIATPGRLMDHMKDERVRLDLTDTVILDEADQMLDLGFVPAVRKILGEVAHPRQTVMFSATMPKPIAKLADEFMHRAQTIAVTPAAKPAEKVKQNVFYVDAGNKPGALVDILAPHAGKRTIVFTRTKRGADRVSRRLQEYGHRTESIHGDKSQGQRDRALNRFKSGSSSVLVATDIAARGIDISDVALVVNYELPNVAESYVHRIGRTARAGAEGLAISLVAPDERKMLQSITKLTGIGPVDLNDAPPMPESAKPKPRRRRPVKSRNRGDKRMGKSNRTQERSANP